MNASESTAQQSEPQKPAEDRLLRASEVQHALGVSRATAYRMIADGTLPSYRFTGKPGGRAMVRVSHCALREWREAHRTRPQNADSKAASAALGTRW